MKSKSTKWQRPEREQDGETPKKPYVAPKLIVHGTIAQITLGGKVGSTDLGGLSATGL